MQHVAVAHLRPQTAEPGCDLRVEDVVDLGAPDAAQDRHVLTAGVHDDLDLRIGEDGGERGEIQRGVERVEHLDAHVAARRIRLDGDLDEA